VRRKMMDLMVFFRSIDSENYCIIKISEQFPQYSSGDDVDIFCYDPDKIARKVLEWGNQYTKHGLEIRVKTQKDYNHATVDFLEGKQVELRFDIYGQLPRYKKLLIKPALFESIIEHSQAVDYMCDGERFTVKIPDIIDDMVLRYIEFIEWYNVRPDKLKHLDYIIEKIDEDKRAGFLDKLHHYTAIPEYYDSSEIRWPLKKTISKILAKFRGRKF
jgi:hypothetical protein